MPLQSPNLDDRTFEQLVSAARARIAATAPEWTDFSPGDPGMTLVEVFAYLAETMIYRLNRVPDKLYVEFLRLIGVRIGPPAAASVKLTFTRDKGAPRNDVEIPRGTRISTGAAGGAGAEAPVFATTEHVVLAADKDSVDVAALNAELVVAELVGRANGHPGTWFGLARPPAISPTGDPLDLLVAVEATTDEIPEGEPAVEWQGKTYRVWREVDNFSDLSADDPVYIADRTSGIVTFAPAAQSANGGGALGSMKALAAIPSAGREVRIWYRRGGGAGGDGAAGGAGARGGAGPGGAPDKNHTPARGRAGGGGGKTPPPPPPGRRAP